MKALATPPKRGRLARLRRGLGWMGSVFVTVAVTALVARNLGFTGPYRLSEPPPSQRICDLHCHTAGIGAGDSGCFISPRLRANFRFRIYLQAFGVTEPDLARSGDALILQRLSEAIAASHSVGSAVVLALDGPVDEHGLLDTSRTEVYIPNEFLARELPRYPNLLFGASINPLRSDALERLEQVARQGAVLVKWIPPIMDFDPADPRLIPFYQRLSQLRLPLLTHTGRENSFTQAQDALGDPTRLRLALEQGVVVIAAHAGSNTPEDPDAGLRQLRQLMKEFPNLYTDVSALTQVNKLGALRKTLADPDMHSRLVYGTDFPLINTTLVSPWYFPLNLSRAEMSRISGINNAWDRDVELKRALGVPAEVFTRAQSLLRHPGEPHQPTAASAPRNGESNSPGTQPTTTTTAAERTTVMPSMPPRGQSRAPSGPASTNTALSTRR